RGKHAVHDFIAGAIASYGKKLPPAAGVGLARKTCSFAWTRRFRDIHFDAFTAKICDSSVSQLTAAAATGSGINDCEEWFGHSGTTLVRSICAPICSASTPRLIFREAVRGKSRSQTTK